MKNSLKLSIANAAFFAFGRAVVYPNPALGIFTLGLANDRRPDIKLRSQMY